MPLFAPVMHTSPSRTPSPPKPQMLTTIFTTLAVMDLPEASHTPVGRQRAGHCCC